MFLHQPTKDLPKKICIGQLYRYVFEGIKFHVKYDMNGSVTNEQKAHLQNIKIANEKKKLTIKSYFIDILNEKEKAISFRQTLRILKAENLEDILFDNHHDALVALKEPYNIFPDDKEITREFDRLNEHYKFFSCEEKNNAQAQFLIYFRAYKLIADHFEFNNDIHNNTAYLHAYKMTVVFGLDSYSQKSKANPFAKIEKYLKQRSHLTACTLQQALDFYLPINNPRIHDLKGWRKLINEGGLHAINIFQMAHKLEELNASKAPKTVKDARKLIAKVTYPRYEEYPDLAILCKYYNYSEDAYNKCLAINKRRKSKDNLPKGTLNGAAFGHPGYFLTKLPIDDPHAFLLGSITHNCLHIGGKGEYCVADGLTLENNGFYVLLKGKPTNDSPIINGKIDYNNFEIVGQSYAWISSTGNLTFDSWENKRIDQDNEVITRMLPEFAKKIVSSSSHILRATIGVGSKTPAELKVMPIQFSEEITEGTQHSDSIFQSLIYFDYKKLLLNKQQLVNKWNELPIKPLNMGGVSFVKFINFDSITSLSQADIINKLFFRSHSLDFLKEQFKKINSELEIIKNLNPDIITLLGIFYQNNIENSDFYSLILGGKINPEIQPYIIKSLQLIQKAQLIDEVSLEIFVILLNFNKDTAINSVFYLNELLKNKVLSKEILLVFFKHPENMGGFTSGIKKLHQCNILTSATLELISLRPNYALLLASSFIKLIEANLYTDYYLKITTYAENPGDIVDGLIILKQAGILSEENAELCSRVKKCTFLFFHSLGELQKNILLTDSVFKLLIKNFTNASNIISILLILHKNNLYTDMNINFIFLHPENAGTILEAIKKLKHFTDNNFKLIISNPEQVTLNVNKTNFIYDLNQLIAKYIQARKGEDSSRFFSLLNNDEIILNVIKKLINALVGKIVNFTTVDAEIIFLKCSELRNITLEYKNNGFLLPPSLGSARETLKNNTLHSRRRIL